MNAPAPAALVTSAQRAPTVVLAGSPNCGKTTLFNRLTGRHGRVGNYPGVTVELLTGRIELPGVGLARLIDLPGAYSLVARSAEEEVAVARLGLGVHPDAPPDDPPDVVVVCADVTQLPRSLYLPLQLQELGVNLVIALTMVDELPEGARPDAAALSAELGCPVVPIATPTGLGLPELLRAVEGRIRAPDRSPRLCWQPSPELSQAVEAVRPALPPALQMSFAHVLWALQSYADEDRDAPRDPRLSSALAAFPLAGERVDDEAICGRYRYLDERFAQLVPRPPERRGTARADAILIHPVLGFGVFVTIMFALFQALFSWSEPAIAAFEAVIAMVAATARAILPHGLFADFVVGGVIAGVGSVIVFLPQILLLFFFVGLMEDSGYMARVAYLMDRVMRVMGLHGRAFVPMLSGFACAVPAIMATRTMERSRDRLLTMMVVPLMTCSARLPVYTLILGALFPAGVIAGVLPLQATLLVAIYALSVVMALIAAFVLSKTVLRAEPVPLVLELPPYRLPRLLDVARMMWRRTSAFVTQAGTVILTCTIALWALLSFPRDVTFSRDYDAAIAATTSPEAVSALQAEQAGERLRASYAGSLGRALEPAIAPLGFDWKIGIGLIGAFAAREVFVATLGVVYSAGEDADEQSGTLRERMRAELREDGRPVYSPLTGLSLLVFFAFACQCMSTLAVVKRETGGYRWPAFLMVYMSALAWLASFLVYQGGRLLGFE